MRKVSKKLLEFYNDDPKRWTRGTLARTKYGKPNVELPGYRYEKDTTMTPPTKNDPPSYWLKYYIMIIMIYHALVVYWISRQWEEFQIF